MLERIWIRSRIGNIAIAVFGIVCAIASAALLAYYVVTDWDASGLIDHALQLMLLFAIVAGGAFVIIARNNLGGNRGEAQRISERSRAPQPRREAAAGVR